MFKRLCLLVLFIGVFPLMGYSSQAVDVLAEIFREKADAVVLIAVQSPEGDKLGSGFFIGRDGRFVTNFHLIAGAQKVVVKLRNGQAFVPIEIINLDPVKDIAVLRIDRRVSKYFALGDSNAVAVGQRVCTIGNPQGLESTISDGLISSIRVDSLGMKVFQISVPLSPGSSGGPLIDLAGHAVGITTAGLNSGENLNFAVPVNYVRILLKKPFDAQRFSRHPWLNGESKRQEKPLSIPAGTRVHIVQKGDTLYRIAQRYKTSVNELMKLNHLSDPKLKIGQTLVLPQQ